MTEKLLSSSGGVGLCPKLAICPCLRDLLGALPQTPYRSTLHVLVIKLLRVPQNSECENFHRLFNKRNTCPRAVVELPVFYKKHTALYEFASYR